MSLHPPDPYSQTRSLSSLETLLGLFEVDDIPDGLEVIRLDVLVLQIVSVLPGVDADQRNVCCKGQRVRNRSRAGLIAPPSLTDKRVLVGGGENIELLRRSVVSDPSPATSLDTSKGSVDLALQSIETPKVLLDGLLQRTRRELSATLLAGSQVGPEEAVVDVACGESKCQLSKAAPQFCLR